MQILVQALFAESGAEGKKPGNHFPSEKVGDTVFAELLLPDVEADADHSPEAVFPELSAPVATLQFGNKSPLLELDEPVLADTPDAIKNADAKLAPVPADAEPDPEAEPLPRAEFVAKFRGADVPVVPDGPEGSPPPGKLREASADAKLAPVPAEAEPDPEAKPLPRAEFVAKSRGVDVPVVPDGPEGPPPPGKLREASVDVRELGRSDAPRTQSGILTETAAAPERREGNRLLPVADRIDPPKQVIERAKPPISPEPHLPADRTLQAPDIPNTKNATVPNRPGMQNGTPADRPVFPVGKEGEVPQRTDREFAVQLPTSNQSQVASAAVTATPAPVTFVAQKQPFADGQLQRDLVALAPDVAAGAPVLDGEEVRPQASSMPRAEALARPVMQQVQQLILRSNMDGLVEVKLSPEELGRVKLSMSQVEAGIAVHITAERVETLDLMRRNIDMLENDLRDQGFENLNFTFDQDGHEDGQESESPAPLARSERKPGVSAEASAASAGITSDGHVDIRL